MLVRFVHLLKVYEPIEVTPFGITMFVRLLQFSKAPPSIEVTLWGIEKQKQDCETNAFKSD